MTIQLPPDLETSVLSLVQRGQFVSVDDAMAEAARLLLRQQPAERSLTRSEFDQQLIAMGLMSQRPDTDADFDDPDDEPISIEGEPLSETVIRERR
jgi:Arc/MetJ-type ribon-helix-helix transcriptional regulator